MFSHVGGMPLFESEAHRKSLGIKPSAYRPTGWQSWALLVSEIFDGSENVAMGKTPSGASAKRPADHWNVVSRVWVILLIRRLSELGKFLVCRRLKGVLFALDIRLR